MNKMQSYNDIAELVKGYELPIGGQNEDGEFVMISLGRTEEGLGRSFQIETLQGNGWSCIHTYWEDGTKEETFKRGNADREAAEDKVASEHALLKKSLLEWVGKVMKTYDQCRGKVISGVDTFHMIQDVDKIVAAAFDHEPVLQ